MKNRELQNEKNYNAQYRQAYLNTDQSYELKARKAASDIESVSGQGSGFVRKARNIRVEKPFIIAISLLFVIIALAGVKKLMVQEAKPVRQSYSFTDAPVTATRTDVKAESETPKVIYANGFAAGENLSSNDPLPVSEIDREATEPFPAAVSGKKKSSVKKSSGAVRNKSKARRVSYKERKNKNFLGVMKRSFGKIGGIFR